jgi:UDP-3-O-[3-hydroxymyristoyl] glucosamine N-acyltransferase
MRAQQLFAHDPDLKVVHGDAGVEIGRPSLVTELTDGGLAFVKNGKFLNDLVVKLQVSALPGAAVILDAGLWAKLTESDHEMLAGRIGTIATSPNVPLSMACVSKPLFDAKFAGLQSALDGRQLGNTQIHPTALISQGVFVGEHAVIGAGAVIHPGVVLHPRTEVGEGCELFANVVIYPFSRLGKRVRVHANSVIGSDGFGYVFHQGVHHKIWHVGGVEIHDDVEIGAGSAIDMGAFTPTVIGAGCRLDNQVQIGHNVKMGRGCIICGQSGVAGSAVLEDYVVLGGRSAVGPDARIGKGTQIAGGAMVNEGAQWPAGSQLGGHPARDLKEWIKTFAWVRKNALKE